MVDAMQILPGSRGTSSNRSAAATPPVNRIACFQRHGARETAALTGSPASTLSVPHACARRAAVCVRIGAVPLRQIKGGHNR